MLSKEQERAQCTLDSIGDAVISTDVEGLVCYLNIVAQRLTGYTQEEALGRRLEEVFQIIDPRSRATVPNPMALAIQENKAISRSPNCVLIRRDGFEIAIEYSAAPMGHKGGQKSGAVMVFYDVSQARALSLMNCVAQHDPLTHLINRVLLVDRLGQAIGLAQQNRIPLAILYLDLDRFSSLNDSLGHAIGDRLLQSAALRFCDCLRASDTVSRVDADEFAVLLPEVVRPQHAAICAAKILQATRLPYLIDEHDLHLTASLGIAIYPNDGAEVETLLDSAKLAMRGAKNRGRDNYLFYRSELNSPAGE